MEGWRRDGGGVEEGEREGLWKLREGKGEWYKGTKKALVMTNRESVR